MIKYTDECVDCGLTCLGRDCPNKRVAHNNCVTGVPQSVVRIINVITAVRKWMS